MNDRPDHKSLSRGISTDMSPEAIARRLEIASQLWDVVNTFGRAKYVGKVDPRNGSEQTVHDAQ